MSDYPEALVEKVAEGIYLSPKESHMGHDRDWRAGWMTEDVRDAWRRYARAALDAIGMREEWAVQLDGDYIYDAPSLRHAESAIDMWGTIPREERKIEHRFTLETEWEPIRE